MVVDCSVVESMSIPNVTTKVYRDSFLVTFFQTEWSLSEILEKLKINQLKN